MTIRHRLFLSNTLMIVLPIILTIAMIVAIQFTFVGMTGINPLSKRHGSISLTDASGADDILQKGSYTQITSNISVYQSDTGSYVMVFPSDVYSLVDADPFPRYIPQAMFFILLIIVFLTNLALTKYITRRIITSIDTLSNGVHEISDGNLTYRIQYNMGDEFDAVCAGFNEMAARLSDMVKQRQKDESNRKELIAGISHDLKTPLTSIKGHIEGLKKGVASTPEMREKYLDIIQCKTEDIEYIIRQLFLFSKMDIGEFPFNFEIVDIGDELGKIVAGLTDEYKERGLAISLKENVHEEFVSIDIVQFGNVVQNILDNSVKYGSQNNAHAKISCHKNDGGVSIIIKDNGPGVSDAALNKIFDVFYREDTARNNQHAGSGLGLAISSKIIERLRGSITAENAQENGLSVIITLPLWKGKARA